MDRNAATTVPGAPLAKAKENTADPHYPADPDNMARQKEKDETNMAKEKDNTRTIHTASVEGDQNTQKDLDEAKEQGA